METQEAAIEPEVVEGIIPEGEDIDENSQDAAPQRDWEAEAKDMGWYPEDQFKGPEGAWKPAEEFVKHGETVLPIVRANNKKLQAEVEGLQQRLSRIDKMNEKALERQKAAHEEQMQEVQQQQRQAVEDGDVELYDNLEKKRASLADSAPDSEPELSNEAVQEKWVADNSWYNSDFDLNDAATRYSQFMANGNPDMPLSENLQKTEAYIKEKFPEKFGGTPRPKPNAFVDPGSSLPGSRKNNSQSLDKIPASDRAIGERHVKEGLFKNMEEWAKDYWAA